MRRLSQEDFIQILDGAQIRPRIKREVRFTTSVAHIDDEMWEHIELLPVMERSGNKGVLLLSYDNDSVYALAYELSRGITSSTGRAQPIICDFCRTWQTGSRSGSITFHKDRRSGDAVSFLCCADLRCSQHVRSKTEAARTSRSQLREDLDDIQRVERLKGRIREIVNRLSAKPVAKQQVD